MKNFIFILASFLVICISANNERNFNVVFEAFQEHYSKIYANEIERLIRFLNFQHNLKKIEDFNSKNNHSWTKSLNQFADLSEVEWKRRLNGYINTHKPNGRKVEAKKSINLKVCIVHLFWITRPTRY